MSTRARLRSAGRHLLTTGTELTPSTRYVATGGDGRSRFERGFGIWAPATNRVTNGGAETNATGYISSGTNTTARSTEQAKFGTASLKCTFTVGGGTGCAVYGVTATAALQQGSMWVYVPSTYDGQGLEIQAASFTSVTLGTTSRAAVDMSLRDQWQRVYQPFTPDSGDLTGDVRLVRTGTAPTAGHEFVYVDGVQVETQPTPTPYIHTDGSTVQRLSSYLRFPIHLIDIAEGWGVAYVRPAWAAALAPDVYSRVLDFNVDASNGVHIYYNYDGGANTKKWAIKSEVGGNADDAFSASQSFTNETAQVVGGVWTRSQVGITVDGAAPTMASRSNGVPDISGQTYFNLGKKNEADSMWLNGEALGMAVGKGPMPSGGFAKVNSLLRAGVGFPNLYPGYCTAVWDGRSTVYRERI